MGGFLGEIAVGFAAVTDFALDGRSGSHKVVQNDGNLTAEILLGERSETPSCFGGEGEVNLPHAGIRRVAILDGAAQVATGDGSRAAQHIPGLARVDPAWGLARLRAAGNKCRAGRQTAAVTSQTLEL